MENCCGKEKAQTQTSCCSHSSGASVTGAEPLAWFGNMIQNCYEYACRAKKEGRPIVGILCEYTPRELILAAGAVPVCLCGGSLETIPAAEEHLPSNLCPLIKSTYGYYVQKTNPFLEMADLIVAETTCDGKKKMYELLGETRPMYVLELPQKPNDPDAAGHWRRELAKLQAQLEKRFGAAITEEKLRGAIELMNRERRLRRELAALMQSDNPPLTGRQLLDFKSSISGIEADLRQYQKAIEIFKAGPVGPAGAAASQPVRVLLTGVPLVHGVERVLEIIESHGGLVVCQENCTGIKPILEDVECNGDPLQALADKYFKIPCSVMTGTTRRQENLLYLSRLYRAQCILELTWQACLTYDVESYHIKKLSEEQLGLPYLQIETDYSPSDSARIATRIEALFESIRSQPCSRKTCPSCKP